MNERWERVGRLFDQLATVPPAQRDSALLTSPEPDDIKSEVRSLLAAHDRAGGFLEDRARNSPADDSSPRSPEVSPELSAGTVVGQYKIKRVAGRGGMGVVYEAEDARLHRRVALKALPSASTGDEAQRLRLRQEARAAAALQHPGIATVYALEEIDGGVFISTEYLEGETLRAEMSRGPQPIERAVGSVIEITRALVAAHDRGIVHRDLKPENIVRTSAGPLKILDFGLAQFEEAAHDLLSNTRLTQHGTVVGTPAYMAPEQLLGQPTDFRVDHFAVGVILYELCVGEHPFGAASLPSTIARILAAMPHAPAASAQLPPSVWNVIDRCLQKNAADRYASTDELLTSLETALRQVQQGQQGQGVQGGQAGQGLHSPFGAAARVPADAPLAPHAPLAPLASTAAGIGGVGVGGGTGPALRWWRFHQFAAAMAYWAMVWPVWYVHRSFGRAGLFLFLATLAAVVVAGTLRLHLWFSSRVYPEDLPAQRADVARWIRAADIAFAALLIVGGIALPETQIGWAAVLISYGIGCAVAFVFIEPATARAAFRAR